MSRRGMRAKSEAPVYDMWDPSIAHITGDFLVLTDRANNFRVELLKSLWLRTSNAKKQFSGDAMLNALALHPFYKRFILNEKCCIPDAERTDMPPEGLLTMLYTHTHSPKRPLLD